MKTRSIAFGKNATTEILEGATIIADAVTATLGPKGRNVAIYRNGMHSVNPLITKDGVTVARNVLLGDPLKRIGADILKHASLKTAKLAGDGTTTSMLLAIRFAYLGKMMEQNHNMSPIEFKRSLEKLVDATVEQLKMDAVSITKKDKEQLKKIATLSANNDSVIGELVAEVFNLVGEEGVVEIQESMSSRTYCDVVQGTQIDRGFITPFLLNDSRNMKWEADSVSVFLTLFKIETGREIEPLIVESANQNAALLIIADDYTPSALKYLVQLKHYLKANFMLVKSPQIADARKTAMDDLSIILDSAVITPELHSFDDMYKTRVPLGFAEKVIVTRDTTTFIGGRGSREDIEEREAQIRAQIKQSKLEFETERLKKRLGSLIGGVAVIYVGAHTEIEMREKKDRMDDAVRATRSALEEGIVEASSFWYYRYANRLTEGNEEAIEVGYANSLKSVFEKIMLNAGVSDFPLPSFTMNLSTMSEEKLFDPAKVIRCSLENACSAATTLLLIDVATWDEFAEIEGDVPGFDLNDSTLFDA